MCVYRSLPSPREAETLSGGGDHHGVASAKRRLLSTTSGRHRLTDGLHYMAGVGVRALAVSPRSTWTRPSLVIGAKSTELDADEWTRYSARSNSLSIYPVSPTRNRKKGPVSPQGLPPPLARVEGTEAEQQHAETTPGPEKEPYHVFNNRQKWQLVVIAGVLAFLAGLSSNIYFPAQDEIARELKISMAMVELTVTSYLLVQGLTCIFWGAFADEIGRRPIYLIAMVLYLLANIALSYSPNFAVLLLFRGVQSGGGASTLILGSGVIQDISPPSSRGTFISFYFAIRNFRIAIGPVLGGALAQQFGFRSIFIFLLIVTVILLLIVVFYLPETLRAIAGNGSLRLRGVYQPWIRQLKEPKYTHEAAAPRVPQKITSRTVLAPLKLLFEKDILVSLLFSGIVYTIWGLTTATTTLMFESTFHLNETFINHELLSKNLPWDFPLERARLRHIPWITAIFIVSVGLYGFSMDGELLPWLTSRPAWIAVPLLLQFLIAAGTNAIIAISQTMISDMCPGQGAGSTAITTFVSRTLNAMRVTFVVQLLEAWGPGFLFLGLGLLGVVYVPMALASWHYGPRWRRERLVRLEKVEEEEQDATMASVIASVMATSTADLEKK
ncbi:major facilitator superfamily transporter [Apiospora arundinis]